MTLDAIRTVAVLGAGTMGNGIAHVFARFGYDRDFARRGRKLSFARARTQSPRNLDREVKKGKD